MHRFLVATPLACMSVLFAVAVQADCCRVVKTSVVTTQIEVRICEPATGAEEPCATPLFIGALEPGNAQEVCSETGTVSHQTYDDRIGGYGAPVLATCDGADIEL